MKAKLILCLVILTLIALPIMACKTTPTATTAPTTAPTSTPTAAPQVFNLKYSIFFNEMEPPGVYSKHFMDYVEKNSNGRVKFEAFFGGTLGSLPEQIKLASTGSVDMTTVIPFTNLDVIPLHAFPNFVLGNQQAALDFNNKIRWGIPETAAILDKEETDNNIKLLNYCGVGENGIIARFVFDSLDDLKGKKIGSQQAKKEFMDYGLNVTSMAIPEFYEAMSRGVVDAITFALGPMAVFKLHEVSKSYMSTMDFAAGQCMTVNLNTWNKLPADLQKVFTDGAKDTVDFSVKFTADNEAGTRKAFSDAKMVVGAIPEKEYKALWDLYLKRAYEDDMLAACVKVGKKAEAETIWKNVLAYYGK